MRIPLPEDLVAAVDKLENLGMDAREFLVIVADPAQPSRFTRDGKYLLDGYGDVERSDEGEDCFDADAATALCVYLAFAVQGLPVGDPFRVNLQVLVDAARARLDNPDLMFGLGTWYGDGKKAKSAQKAWFDTLGGTHWAPPRATSRRGAQPHRARARQRPAAGLLRRGRRSGRRLAPGPCPGRGSVAFCWNRRASCLVKKTGDPRRSRCSSCGAKPPRPWPNGRRRAPCRRVPGRPIRARPRPRP